MTTNPIRCNWRLIKQSSEVTCVDTGYIFTPRRSFLSVSLCVKAVDLQRARDRDGDRENEKERESPGNAEILSNYIIMRMLYYVW